MPLMMALGLPNKTEDIISTLCNFAWKLSLNFGDYWANAFAHPGMYNLLEQFLIVQFDISKLTLRGIYSSELFQPQLQVIGNDQPKKRF